MKTTKILIILMLSFTTYIKAQTAISILQNNGTQLQIPLNSIDSITYSISSSNYWFNPSLQYGSVTDQDGNTYKTILIANQEWMAENLRTTKYSNGDPIPNVSNQTQWFNQTTGAWVYYNNNSQFNNNYGKLYNWYVASDSRNVCPSGWHVPLEVEWNQMINILGGLGSAGGKMKSSGTQFWTCPNIDATNETGFSSIPAGRRDNQGVFDNITYSTGWWCSNTAFCYGIWNNYYSVYSGSTLPKYGLSIRCLKDMTSSQGYIGSINCGIATSTGTLTVGTAANGVSSTVPYTAGNGGTHNGQTVNSTGVTGLTATLTPGNFTTGVGTLVYTITGTPNSSGTASFSLNIGGQTCTLTRTVVLPVGTITTLSCGAAINSGTLSAGTAASGVSSSVPYAGGNGGTHNGQAVTSTGITGLTATLVPGNFVNGSGSLIYTITGTPSSNGIANFALNIGGQACILSISVAFNFASQYPAGTVFCASGPTAIVDVTNPITGKIWMDRNLGATQVAASSTSTSAVDDLYQWGRAADGHQCRNSTMTSAGDYSSSDQPGHGDFILVAYQSVTNFPFDWRSPENPNLWQGVNGINNPCPSGYRLPTTTEFMAEHQSWISSNSSGAFASPLKLPMTGNRSSTNGNLYYYGTYGYYWSSTVNGNKSNILTFNTNSAGSNTQTGRATGCSVRCIKN
jgi:uncharacterized protein (TIGR02145 family)